MNRVIEGELFLASSTGLKNERVEIMWCVTHVNEIQSTSLKAFRSSSAWGNDLFKYLRLKVKDVSHTTLVSVEDQQASVIILLSQSCMILSPPVTKINLLA